MSWFDDNGDERNPRIYEQGGITGDGMHTQVQPGSATGAMIPPAGGYDYAGVDSNGKNLYRDAQGNTFTDDQNGVNGLSAYGNPGAVRGGKPKQGTREWVDYMFAQTPGNRKPTDKDYQYWLDPERRGSNPDNWDYVEQRMLEPDTGGGGGAQQNMLSPWTKAFQAPAAANLPEFQKPADFKFDATGVLDDPGFQGRLKEANDALQRSAAAKGTLLTGQTLKDLGEQSQVFASNEIGNAYGRQLGTYDTNYRGALDDYAKKYGRASDTYNRAFNEYGVERENFYNNQDRPFGKLFSMAQLDSSNNNAYNANQLGWASLYGNTVANGSNAYNGYLTGGANATAAGQVGSGNARAGMVNGIANTGLGLYLNSQSGDGNRNVFGSGDFYSPHGPYAGGYK